MAVKVSVSVEHPDGYMRFDRENQHGSVARALLECLSVLADADGSPDLEVIAVGAAKAWRDEFGVTP